MAGPMPIMSSRTSLSRGETGLPQTNALRLGDLVAIRDHYDFYGRGGRYQGAVTIGVVIHGFIDPGLNPILSALKFCFQILHLAQRVWLTEFFRIRPMSGFQAPSGLLGRKCRPRH